MLIVVVFAWTMERMTDVLTAKNEQYLEEIISMEAASIERKFAKLANIIYTYGYESSMEALMNCDDGYEYYELCEAMNSRLRRTLSLNDEMIDYVFLGQTRDFSVTGELGAARKLRDDAGSDFKINTSGLVYYYGKSWKDTPALILGSPIYAYSLELHRMEYIGYSAVVCYADQLLIHPNSGQKIDTRFYLVDSDGLVCAQSGGQALYGEHLENHLSSEEFIVHRTNVGLNMQLISLTEYEALYGEIGRVWKGFSQVFFAGMTIILLIFTLSIRSIVRPIHHLSQFIAMMRFTKLDVFQRRIEPDGPKEMVDIANQFNRMLEQIHAMALSLLESSEHLHKAKLEQERIQLYSLRNQINPHFLYNTLECAKGLAYQNNLPSLACMMDSMARIFRYSIKGSGMVLLKEELAISRAYLSIQQARFCGRFETAFEIEDRAHSAVVPKMILQPLIENSVFHGIEPSMDPCRLSIRAMIDESNALVLEVEDDGEGMDAQTLSALQNHIEACHDGGEVHHSIGVSNIAYRIRLIYGAHYGLKIESELAKGTRIILRLPFKEDCK